MIGTIVSFFASASIGTIIGGLALIVLCVIVGCISTTLVSLMSTNVASWVTNWITIPEIGSLILWGQAIAIVVVIIIRVAIGINNGILKDEIKAPEYLFKSVGAVVLIGLMPIAVDFCILFAQYAVSDVTTWRTPATTFSTNSSDFLSQLSQDIAALNGQDNLLFNMLNLLLCHVAILIVALILVTILFQLFVRQVEMGILSVVAPWIGIKTATENSSGEYWEFLQSMIGMGVAQVVQYFMFVVSLNLFDAWYNAGPGEFIGSADIASNWQKFLIVLAVVIATSNISSLLSRWMFSGGTTNSMTRIAPMLMGRLGGSKGGSKIGNSIGGQLGGLMKKK